MVLTKSVSLFEFVSITDSEMLSPGCTITVFLVESTSSGLLGRIPWLHRCFTGITVCYRAKPAKVGFPP